MASKSRMVTIPLAEFKRLTRKLKEYKRALTAVNAQIRRYNKKYTKGN